MYLSVMLSFIGIMLTSLPTQSVVVYTAADDPVVFLTRRNSYSLNFNCMFIFVILIIPPFLEIGLKIGRGNRFEIRNLQSISKSELETDLKFGNRNENQSSITVMRSGKIFKGRCIIFLLKNPNA